MQIETVKVRGEVRPDGTLILGQPLGLPAGPVDVVVTTLPTPAEGGEGLMEMLERFRREQEASGHTPRTREEIDADLQMLRDELDEHALAVERLQESIWAEKNANRPPC
jgi:hypothetical protein